jgi:hypothetical protein
LFNRAAFALLRVTFIILFRKLRTTIKILDVETDVAIKNEITNLFGHSRTPHRVQRDQSSKKAIQNIQNLFIGESSPTHLPMGNPMPESILSPVRDFGFGLWSLGE